MRMLRSIQDHAETAACWLVVFSAFAVPLPAAWISLSTLLFLLAWLCAGRFAERWAVIRRNPLAVLSLVLCGWMAVAIAWSPAEAREAIDNWWHYRELLLLAPMLSVVARDDRNIGTWQARILLAFVLGFCVALGASFLRWFGVLPDMGFRGMYAGFGGRTGFSLMLVFVTYVCLEQGRLEPWHRSGWALLGLLCLGNLFFINSGRTGQAGLLVLVPLALSHWLGLRGLIASVLVAPLLAAGLYFGVPVVQQRVAESAEHIAAFEAGRPETGDGLRLEFWFNSVDFIRQAPLLGAGTGGYAVQYRQLAAREGLTGPRVSDNPHNEYLMIASQQGLVGLALLLALWGVQWRGAARLPPVRRNLTRALLLLIATGDLFNSFLLDNMEGHFYLLLSIALCARWPARPAAVPVPSKVPLHG